MLRWKIAEFGLDAFHFRHHQRCDAQQGSKKATRLLIGVGSIISGLASFALFCTLAFACCAQDISRAQTSGEMSDQPSDARKAAYADALAYCSGSSPNLEKLQGPEALRPDRRVLCFDGLVSSQSDLLLANGLEHGGIFVVRSKGGDVAATIALADLLLLKDATVVIKDYCLQACADYLFMATARTFVPKDALVAWTLQLSDPDNCLGFSKTSDPRAPLATEGLCPGSLVSRSYNLRSEFYRGRIVLISEPSPKGVSTGSTFSPYAPPESVAIRRILKRKFDEIGRFPESTYWTWNPRYYASRIKTKVFNEAYPQSQDEVDAIVERLGLAISVIYDP